MGSLKENNSLAVKLLDNRLCISLFQCQWTTEDENSCKINREHDGICSSILWTWLNQTQWSHITMVFIYSVIRFRSNVPVSLSLRKLRIGGELFLLTSISCNKLKFVKLNWLVKNWPQVWGSWYSTDKIRLIEPVQQSFSSKKWRLILLNLLLHNKIFYWIGSTKCW